MKTTFGEVLLWILIGLVVLLILRYLTMGKTRRVYINSIIKQIPSLLSRYRV
jgi:hypothetical protein